MTLVVDTSSTSLATSRLATPLAVAASIAEFRYWRGPHPILQEIDIKVRPGEFVVIVGPTGSGKTTLCYCLAGVIPNFVQGAYRGVVCVKGQNLAELRLPEIARSVGFVLQRPENQLFNRTVAEDVAFGPENLGLPRAAIQDRVARSLASVGMAGFENRHSGSLSGGETRRVALACVLALEPELLILDQPTAEIDPAGRRQVYECLGRESRSAGRTIIVVDDHLEEALPFATRLILLREGRVVNDVRPEEVLSGEKSLAPAARVATRVRYQGLLGEGRQACQNHPEARPVVLQARELCFRYPDSEGWALRDVDLTFRQGEFAAIIGGNGAGKTTLAKHFIGLLRPRSGKVLVGGRDAGRLSTARLSDSVGYLFQDPDHQVFCNSVYEEVAFSLKLRKVPNKQIEESVGRTLEKLGLDALRDRHPYTLSRGQRQRLAFASILVRQPETLVADEPTSGLDWQGATELLDLLAAFNRAGGTVLLITHDLESVLRYAIRTVVMAGGQVRLDTPTSQLGGHSATPAAAGIPLPNSLQSAQELGMPSPPRSAAEVQQLI